MRLVAMNWNPSGRQLRQFGLTAMVVLPPATWLLSHGNATAFGIAAAGGAVMAAAGFACPNCLKPIFITVSLITMPIGMIVSELSLLFVFWGVFVPLGLFFRLIGRDALELRSESNAKTYWSRKKGTTSPAGYLRQW